MDRSKAPTCDIAIIGGGAAGLAAAIEAATCLQRQGSGLGLGRIGTRSETGINPVVVLERLDRVGKKILATGNGRCNLSHQPVCLDDYHGLNRSFAGPALGRYDVAVTLDWFRQMGLLCRTGEDGRVFPYSYQATAVLDILRRALDRLPVTLRTSFRVSDLRPKRTGEFLLTDSDGQRLYARSVIVTTGGLAAPSFGCSGDGYSLLTRLGHRMVETKPAIVQINCHKDAVRGLAGIRVNGTATLMCRQKVCRQEQGEILFTDYGLSGPPILQLSRAVHDALEQSRPDDATVHLDFLPELSLPDLVAWLKKRQAGDPSLPLQDFLNGLLHKKAGMALVKQACGCSLAEPLSVLPEQAIQKLATLVKDWPLVVTGTQGWQQAQVTAGGVTVDDFAAETLASRLVPGLFAAGEVLDIDGDCGGYNLQWAWSSGRLAGAQAAAFCHTRPKDR